MLLHIGGAFGNLEPIGKRMKIQEMRPGVLQLNRRVEAERRDNLFEILADQAEPDRPDNVPGPVILSELDQPCWSVVSFDRLEASGLSYEQASALLRTLDVRGVTGLCVVTDTAGRRLKS